MMNDEQTAPASNADQIAYWNEVGGPKWVRYAHMLDQQLKGVGAATMDAARPDVGECILDIGCGCGATTFSLSRRAGPLATCTGVDISRPMLELARQRAENETDAKVSFLEADAQTHEFPVAQDLIFSRFGVMFFEDPTIAFTNLHRALRPKGRMAFVCWQPLPRNQWISIPMMAALEHVSVDAPPSPNAPGPFAFADPQRVEQILTDSGYHEISVRGLDIEMTLGGGGDAAETVDFLLDLGPLGRLLASESEEKKETVKQAVLRSISGYDGGNGVKMAGAVWIVTAKA